jgi:hypothetical protein
MIKPRTIQFEPGNERPTLPFPKTDRDFGGWGPRLRY